jgi:hypothetical protein
MFFTQINEGGENLFISRTPKVVVAAPVAVVAAPVVVHKEALKSLLFTIF